MRKVCMVSTFAVGVLAAPFAQAAVVDDFSTDHTYYRFWGAGGPLDSWSIVDEAMSPTLGIGITDGWYCNNDSLSPGDSVSIDIHLGVDANNFQAGFRLEPNERRTEAFQGPYILIRTMGTGVIDVNNNAVATALSPDGPRTGYMKLAVTRGTGADQDDMNWEVTCNGVAGSGTTTIAGLLETDVLWVALETHTGLAATEFGAKQGYLFLDNLAFPADPTCGPEAPIAEGEEANSAFVKELAPGDDFLGHKAYVLGSTESPYGYLVHAPQGEDLPLLIFLHGGDETGNSENQNTRLRMVAKHGPSRLIRNGLWNPPTPMIVVSPQTTDGWWWPKMIHGFIEYIMENYPVDRSRIYLTGLSRGGTGSFDYINMYGDDAYVAAMLPMATDAIVRNSGEFNPVNFLNTPIWLFINDKDICRRLCCHRSNDQINHYPWEWL
jgi:hypothetical protein